MRLSKWNRLREKRARKSVVLAAAEARLDSAIDAAKAQYTGLLGGRGSVFDDPKVRAAMRHRDRILRDLVKISYAHGGERR